MINIVIPMAGAGSRFASVGYINPKPLIEINGVPMIQLVINNLKPRVPHRFIFICQNQHISKYNLDQILPRYAPNAIVIGIDGITEGAACSVLAARELINNNDQLMIANSDQYVEFSVDNYLDALEKNKLDGLIMTMYADDPKWSFVSVDGNGLVTSVVEKQVISNEATVGIYNFRKGGDFIVAAEAMISKNIRTNGEFYVAPAYNEMINNSQKVGIFNVGSEGVGMHGLGIPEDLNLFLNNPICRAVTKDML